MPLAGCDNFRDLGGYATTDGRRTRWRRLFRADGLSQLTDEDHRVLVDLGIGTVIDLRTPLEAETRGRFSPTVDAVGYHHLPLTDTLPGEEQAPDWGDAAFVTARYRRMLSEGTAVIVEAVRLLADPANLPAVFHCSVGKDRTGVLAAVVLGFLQVPEATIVEDYALSRAAMLDILGRLRREFPDATDIVERYAPVILSVQPAAMRGLLAGVVEDYGSFDELARSLAITDEVARLRAALLQGA
ncbi:MAG TPA: tyrosine-protein phosphatase [Acidimicrobiales bacterium]|nr:tyrosine-protein phosphatase [Acidimicrobiales bacterium]